MEIAEILELLGVAEPLIARGAQLFGQMIADARNTTTEQETAALNDAVTQAAASRANYEASGPQT